MPQKDPESTHSSPQFAGRAAIAGGGGAGQSAFLDVDALINQSSPEHRRPWAIYAAGALALLAVAGSLGFHTDEGADLTVRMLTSVAMIGLMIGLSVMGAIGVQAQRSEQQGLESVEELIQLRRWPEAAWAVQGLLSTPARTQAARIAGLLHLSTVLGRLGRHADAIGVQDYVLEHVRLDPLTTHALKVARVMAMLHDDRLFDADRAIADLRKSSARLPTAPSLAELLGAEVADAYNHMPPLGRVAAAKKAGSGDDGAREPAADDEDDRGASDDEAFSRLKELSSESRTPPPRRRSAGLSLVEIYRDVKTGHPLEAIELYEREISSMRDQLGHRAADAHVLAAKSYDLLGRHNDAARAYEKATVLAPAAELQRRYPEVASLAARYAPAAAPVE